MRKILKRIIISFCICLFLFMTACSNKELATGDVKYNFSVNANEINIEVGEKFQIFATYGNYQIIYTSLDLDVATVTQSGEVLGISEGVTYIRLDTEKESFNIKVVVNNLDYTIELEEKTSFVMVKNSTKILSVVLKKEGTVVDEKLTFACDKTQVKIDELTNSTASIIINEIGFYEIKVLYGKDTSLNIMVKVMSENACKLDAPQLSLTNNIVSWENNEKASGYMLKIDDGEWQSVKNNTYNLSGITAKKLYVYAVSDSFDFYDSNITAMELK